MKYLRDKIAYLKFVIRGRNSHISKGKFGEDLARSYLKYKRFTILAKNRKIKGHEIDIIATDKDNLVFVEVKTRTANFWVDPVEVVSRKDQLRIKEAARLFAKTLDKIDISVRFDIVAVYLLDRPVIKHIRSAF